ncbi:hypothetical protein EV426DRAFT_700667 [Tirmania nivea]|nr:hypothetical protein EV426DRAFT_700667 [Tirmania nivea]
MPLCQLCNVTESRYKCPTCFIPYCSLACYKPHKTVHEAKPPPAPSEPPTSTTTELTSTAAPPPPEPPIPPPSATTASTPTPSRYTSLLAHPTLLSQLRSTPSLHSLLYQIYLTTLEPPSPTPPKPTTTPSNPYKITKHIRNKPIWTPAAGVAKGVKRLTKIREKVLAKGGNGGPLEEFVGMVVECIGEGGEGE